MSSDDEVWRLARELTIDGERDDAIVRLIQIGAASVPILIKFLGQGSATSPGQQRGAIEALAGIGDAAVPGLVECLNMSPDAWARLGAADALSIQGKGYLAVPALTVLLQGSPDTGRFAAMTLGRMGEVARPAVPALTSMMKSHPLNWSRVDAAAALARLGETKTAVPVLIGFLRDRQWEVRISAWRGLRDVADSVTSHSKKLAKLAEAEEHPWVSGVAAEAISRITDA